MTPYRARSSRPLRALGLILSGWIAVRAVMLWPQGAPIPTMAESPTPDRKTGPTATVTAKPPAPSQETVIAGFAASASGRVTKQTPAARAPVIAVIEQPPPPRAMRGADMVIPRVADEAGLPPEITPPPRLALQPASPKRFALSAWAVYRRGSSGPALATAGVLGASQAGFRVIYGPVFRGLALTARLSAPIETRGGREASAGIALRRGAVGLLVEHRIALDAQGRSVPSITAFGGFSEKPLPEKFRADGYAQFGIVGIRDRAAFVDGALRIERPVLKIASLRVTAGAGAWGGAQPGLARLDIGPQIVARVPVAKRTLRLSAEWRERAYGNAAPGSGLSLTAGFDF